MRLRPYIALAMTLCLLAAVPMAFAQMAQKEVEEALTCQCGCGLTVANCNHLQCGFAIPVREEIAAALAAGETGEQIIAGYRTEYGEKVLSAPTKEGFNLLAWITPYAAILFGALVIVLTVRRWTGTLPAEALPGAAGGGPSGLGKADRERIARELEELD